MMDQSSKHKIADLPPIPEKRYFTIGEVSQLCAVKPHVLRYWEQEFRQLRPSKRRGNRRYYQLKDVQMARQIRYLLYEQGYTITGARQRLLGEKVAPTKVAPQQAAPNQAQIKKAITDLEALLEDLQTA